MVWSKGKIQFWKKLEKRQGWKSRKTKNIKKKVVTEDQTQVTNKITYI
jgi:hypothetical protein